MSRRLPRHAGRRGRGATAAPSVREARLGAPRGSARRDGATSRRQGATPVEGGIGGREPRSLHQESPGAPEGLPPPRAPRSPRPHRRLRDRSRRATSASPRGFAAPRSRPSRLVGRGTSSEAAKLWKARSGGPRLVAHPRRKGTPPAHPTRCRAPQRTCGQTRTLRMRRTERRVAGDAWHPRIRRPSTCARGDSRYSVTSTSGSRT